MALPTEIDSSRLERDELEMLQARALRSWRDSDWLARTRPAAWDRLGDFPAEVWLDLGGGVGESQQTPGAIVTGYGGPIPERTGERRQPDLPWNLTDGVPAATASVDKIIVPESALRPYAPATQDFILGDIARALRVGGTLVIRDDSSLLSALRPVLDRLGFTLASSSARLDNDNEHTYTLTQQTSRDVGSPIGRETVLGETRPPSIRVPYA